MRCAGWQLIKPSLIIIKKTQAITCGSKASQLKVSGDSIHIAQSVIPLSDTLRDLEYFFDKHFLMANHISSIVMLCFFHLCCLGKLWQFQNRKTANAIAVSLVLSRLDYCSSYLWGMPKNQLLRLQWVQNTAARILTQRKRLDHITPILCKLHWLPVEMHIDYKILSLV